MIDIPDHLKWWRLGEEIESISYNRRDRNVQSIPQLDSTTDSRNSLSLTPDSVDLTKSPDKYRNEFKDNETDDTDISDNDTEKTDEDTDDDRYDTVKFNKSRTPKVYKANIEKKKLLKERREKTIQNAKDRNADKVNAQAAL